MTDGEYRGRWRTLISQLRDLERKAGIGDAADRLRHPGATTAMRHEPGVEEPGGDGSPDPYSLLRDAAQLRELRALYFNVGHSPLRNSLIAKQRELALFERTGIRTRLDAARRDVEALRRRASEGWWIAAVVGASLVIIGYVLFAVFGAIAGGAAALFVGNGIEQSARRRFEHAIAIANEEMSLAAAVAATADQMPPLFSEIEGATGLSDRPSETSEQVSVATH